MHGGITISDLGKKFRRRSADAPRTAKEWLLRGRKANGGKDHFWALRSLSLEIRPGEMVGVIGHNGSGKSTLLRLIGGVMMPDEGQVDVRGRVSGLLTLNTGMHEDLSGRENIVINGVIAGLSRTEVKEKLDDIIRFAELESFIDNPVRTYSSGMKLRLGFATAAHVEPDILLIDEVLSVGDMAFQQKCLDRIEQFRKRGCTIVLITHEIGQVEKLCDRAIWLDQGRVAGFGEPAMVIDAYRDAMGRETRARTKGEALTETTPQGAVLEMNKNRFGSLEATIASVRLLDLAGREVERITGGDPLVVEITCGAAELQEQAILSIGFGNSEQVDCLEINNEGEGVALPVLQQLGTVRIVIDRLDLAPGAYALTVGLYKRDWSYALDYHWRVYPLLVEGRPVARGTISPPREWNFSQPAGVAETTSN